VGHIRCITVVTPTNKTYITVLVFVAVSFSNLAFIAGATAVVLTIAI
jgi:hypothetical protein